MLYASIPLETQLHHAVVLGRDDVHFEQLKQVIGFCLCNKVFSALIKFHKNLKAHI